MTKPPAFITSVRVERSGGAHEYVTVWIRGQNVGTLCVGKGDGEPLAAILNGEAPAEAAPVWAELEQRPCIICLRPKCSCTNPSRCGRCHGCMEFAKARQNAIEDSWRDERPFHVAPEDTPTLMDPTPHEITPWMRGSLEAMRSVPATCDAHRLDETCPNCDAMVRAAMRVPEPAQKLAVQAFAAEQENAPTKLAYAKCDRRADVAHFDALLDEDETTG